MAIYRSGGFLRYAAQQVAACIARLTEHAEDALGLCRRCGRVYPCPDAAEATRLLAHYGSYSEPPPIVRPYVSVLPISDSDLYGTRTTVSNSGGQHHARATPSPSDRAPSSRLFASEHRDRSGRRTWNGPGSA